MERAFPPHEVAPKLGLDETVELLTRVLGASEEDPDLSALSAALKNKLELSDLKKPPSTMSPGVELLTRDVKSCRGIRSSPMDTCPSPFHLRVRTVPVCNVGDTSEAEMKSCGLAALAPLAITHPSPPTDGTGGTGGFGRGTKAIATANLQIKLSEFDPKNLPKWAEEFFEILLVTGQQHADIKTKCTFIKKSCKKKFLQRQVKTAIRKSSNWGDFVKRLEQMYPVYETDPSVHTEIEELSSLPKFPTAARISEFVAQLEELMGRMNPTSSGPNEPHLWLVGKIPPKTWENCRETSERKARTHSYDDLIYLLMELAMERRMTPTWTSLCASIDKGRPLLRGILEGGLNPTPTLVRAVVGSRNTCKRPPPPMAKGFPVFSTAILWTTKVDLATPMNVMGEAFASSNCNVSRRLQMVRR